MNKTVLIILLFGIPGSCLATEVPEAPITSADRQHWAYRPLVHPEVPAVKDQDWSRNSIDKFILARLEKSHLAPLPGAGRATLIRRLSFDLTGLPPTPEAIDAFVGDESPDAYKKLVDGLLDSEGYGEHWAQHWLDLARFAETDGFEHDKVRSQAWRYRDWVIKAMNRDMPYDRFVRLQIAGDEIAPNKDGSHVATTFVLSGPDMPDINSQQERRSTVLNELTGTVCAVLLGMQMGCAECHDHKYDPLSQKDFYRLRAIFEPGVQVKANRSLTVLREPLGKIPTSYLLLRGDWRHPGPRVEPGFPRVANVWNDTVPEKSDPSQSSGRRTALANWLTRPDHPLTARVIVNRLWQHHFGQGLSRTPSDFGVMGDPPTHDKLLDWLATELVRRKWSLKSIHRLMVSSATYRLASRASDPTWSAATRREAHQNIESLKKLDPDNLLQGRASRKRLSGEAIRDAILLVSHRLSSRQGGPGVMPPLPAELVQTLLKNQWKTSPDEEDHRRRSIYVFARRNLRYPIFEAFDRPDANLSCPRRNRSTTALQSLLLLNSEQVLRGAQHLAGYVLSHAPNDRVARIQMIYRRALGRMPTAEEISLGKDFLDRQSAILKGDSRERGQLALPVPCPAPEDPHQAAALTDYCLAILNSNEFVYLD